MRELKVVTLLMIAEILLLVVGLFTGANLTVIMASIVVTFMMWLVLLFIHANK